MEGHLLEYIKSFPANFKKREMVDELKFINPIFFKAIYLYFEMCRVFGFPPCVTNILEKQLWSKSNTHPEGRAVDLRTRGLNPTQKRELIQQLNFFFLEFGAISATTGKQRFCVLEDEYTDNEHLHLQIGKF
jgi:hypothetical protein